MYDLSKLYDTLSLALQTWPKTPFYTPVTSLYSDDREHSIPRLYHGTTSPLFCILHSLFRIVWLVLIFSFLLNPKWVKVLKHSLVLRPCTRGRCNIAQNQILIYDGRRSFSGQCWMQWECHIISVLGVQRIIHYLSKLRPCSQYNRNNWRIEYVGRSVYVLEKVRAGLSANVD